MNSRKSGSHRFSSMPPILLLSLVLLALMPLILRGQQPATVDGQLTRTVISAGAVSSTGSVSILATIGQSMVGRVQAGSGVALLGFWPTGISTPTGIGNYPPGLTRGLDVSIFPNPFHERTNLHIVLEQSSRIQATVYDISGRLVTDLAKDVRLQPGTRSLTWDGKNDQGIACLPGLYFLKVEAHSVKVTEYRVTVQPMLLLR
ncbi:MAG: T9SS type A sorting domain-containing protein [Bacteroidota bacterium]